VTSVPGPEPSSSPGPGEEEEEGSTPEALLDAQTTAVFEEAGVPVPDVDPVAAERDSYRDSLQRLQADFENYRKRVAKQDAENRERANEQLVAALLPVLDTADLALSHGAGEDVKQLSGSLFGALEKEGLEKITAAGEPFDPTCHEAVAHEPGDGGPQEVSEVLRAGYRWRGRVLRAAMVKVRG
jgi:molecular chaperone GrpE